ncbi:MAG: FAD:protein FMN transferase, partial [Treponemataceae bacterium]
MKFLVMVIVLFCFSCKPQITIEPYKQFALGTICSVNIFEHGSKQIYAQITELLSTIENEMSFNIPSSYISQININAGKKSVKVSENTYFVIKTALEYAKKSQGVFDPSIGPLVALWDIAGDNPHVPDEKEIQKLLPLVNYADVLLNDTEYSVFLKKEGMAIDIGGIAKGFAADEIRRLLTENNIPSGVIDLGGNIYAMGTKNDGSLWSIGIRDPITEGGTPVARIEAINQSVVTSGAYERFFEQDGKRFHHILDTKTGYP